jgi:hypothetical protein
VTSDGRNPLLVTHHALRVKAVELFNNPEEVKVPVRGERRVLMRMRPRAADRELGLIASRIQHTKGLNAADTSFPVTRCFRREPEGSGL